MRSSNWMAWGAGVCAVALASPVFAQQYEESVEIETEAEYESAAEVDPAPQTRPLDPARQEPMAQEPVQRGPVVQEPVAREPVAQEPMTLSSPPTIVERERTVIYRPLADAGAGFLLGGGVGGFIEAEPRGFTDPGGQWNARLTLGHNNVIGGELAYIGQVQNIQALGLDSSAYLLGNGAEAAARVNFTTDEVVQPYLMGGVGWTHYALSNDDFNTSAIRDADNVLHFPVGAGVGFRVENALIDLRGVVRPSVGGDMFGEGEGDMHTWGANLNAGWQF